MRGEEEKGSGGGQQHLASVGDGRGKGGGHTKLDNTNLQQSDVSSDGGDGGVLDSVGVGSKGGAGSEGGVGGDG